MDQFKIEDLKAGYLITLTNGRSYLLIPNQGGLQLVYVKTSLSSFDLIDKDIRIVNWFTSLKHVNDDLTIDVCNSKFYINKVYGLASFGSFWSESARELLWEREQNA